MKIVSQHLNGLISIGDVAIMAFSRNALRHLNGFHNIGMVFQY